MRAFRAAQLRQRARERFGSRRSRIALLAALVVIVAAVVAAVVSSSPSVTTRNAFVTGTPEGATPVKIDTTVFLPETTPAPAVLLTQGFGGDKSGLRDEATTLAQHGYVVLTYSARGFGRSGGLIHFASPNYEIRDAKLLVDHLVGMKQVLKIDGRPQIGAAGSSYGGGMSLLLAAADPRVRAVAADITWNDLQHAFFPNFAGSGPGVFKRLWLGALFGNGFGNQDAGALGSLGSAATGGGSGSGGSGSGGSDSGSGSGGGSGSTGTSGSAGSALGSSSGSSASGRGSASASCGNFAPDVCAAYQASAATGKPTPALLRIMRAASPSTYLSRIRVPTLLSQGEQDSLFPLSEADANARGIAANGTPVRVVWRQGGHDDSSAGGGTATSAAISWFDAALHGKPVPRSQSFEFAEQAGVISAATGDVSQQVLRAHGYPGVAGTGGRSRAVNLLGPAQTIAAPAGGAPAVITSIPGLGGISARFDQALALLPSAPGQTAVFASPRLGSDLDVVGGSTVRLTVTAKQAGDAVLFAGLRDLGTDGTATLPSQLVTPLRVPGLQAGVPTTVTVHLPAVVRNVRAGHRLVLTVSTTDFAYANPATPGTFSITLDGSQGTVTVPTVSGTPIGGGHPITWLIVGLVACALVALGVGAVLVRRRLVLRPDPELADVPVCIDHLVKEYAGGYRAVDDVSFRVERGQVVGLLGPNGAGKTTALRTLVGLITPTSGSIHVFGAPVVPGAPVLARLGAFIEGPGFLPHLTGRENLRLFWAATGRPADEAEFDVALDIAGLGDSVDRRVRAYSHGMKQRLGIAQAMLGLPELLVLDEPTNGLDPPQIAEMREVLREYAQTGRTVIVSSHLLAEVEQTCTHVVVMHRGRLVAAGSVDEVVAGAAGTQLAVGDPAEAARVLAAAGIGSELVPARRALEDVFLEMIGEDSA